LGLDGLDAGAVTMQRSAPRTKGIVTRMILGSVFLGFGVAVELLVC